MSSSNRASARNWGGGVFAAVVALIASTPAQARHHNPPALPSPGAALTQPAATASASDFTIRFDDTAVRQLITLVQNHDEKPEDVDAWLNLPANQHLIRIGMAEGNLTSDQLRANAIEVIEGKATSQSQPSDSMGCLRLTTLNDYVTMLDGLENSADARAARIAAHDAAFAPPGTKIDETIYVHLGGDWDALNDNGIYINMRPWHDAQSMSWEGLDMIVAHETMHTVQTMAYGNPQDQASGPGAWFTALSKIQREGTARYIEYDTDPAPYHPVTYGFVERAIDTERLRAFPTDMALLEPLYESCFPTLDAGKFTDAYTAGMNVGGPYYDIGNGIAKTIDDRLGRAALLATISGGPKVFYNDYRALTVKDATLPKLPDAVAASIPNLPDKI